MDGLLNSRQEIIERLSFLASCGHRFSFLSGKQGAGKSAILEFLLEYHFKDYIRKFVSIPRGINDIQSRSNLVDHIFSDPLFDPELPLSETFLALGEMQGQTLVVIDNGQNMTESVFKELLAVLGEPTLKHFHFVFACREDSSLAALIKDHPAVVTVEVDPLDEHESLLLLQHYFHDLTLNEEVQAFIDKSGGLPASLMKWPELDSIDPVEEGSSSSFNLDYKWVVVLAIVALALAVTVQLMFFTDEAKQPASVEQTDVATDNKSEDVAKALETLTQKVEAITTEPSESDENESVELALAGSADILIKDEQPESTTPDTVENHSTSDDVLANEADTTDSAVIERDASNQLASENVADDSENEDAGSSVEPKPSDIQSPNTSTDETAVNDEILADSDDSSTNSAPVAAQMPVHTAGYMKSAQWFSNLEENSYFLQLTGVSSVTTLEQFLRFHRIEDIAVVYQIERNNKPWYVVLLGPYTSIDSAKNAVSFLPKHIQSLSPWAKSTKAVNKAVQQHQAENSNGR